MLVRNAEITRNIVGRIIDGHRDQHLDQLIRAVDARGDRLDVIDPQPHRQHDARRRGERTDESPYPPLSSLGGEFRWQLPGSGQRLLNRVVDTVEYNVPLSSLKLGMVNRTVRPETVSLDEPRQ